MFVNRNLKTENLSFFSVNLQDIVMKLLLWFPLVVAILQYHASVGAEQEVEENAIDVFKSEFMESEMVDKVARVISVIVVSGTLIGLFAMYPILILGLIFFSLWDAIVSQSYLKEENALVAFKNEIMESETVNEIMESVPVKKVVRVSLIIVVSGTLIRLIAMHPLLRRISIIFFAKIILSIYAIFGGVVLVRFMNYLKEEGYIF